MYKNISNFIIPNDFVKKLKTEINFKLTRNKMPNKNYEQSKKNVSSKQSENQKKHNEVKNIIMDHLQNYKAELNDRRSNSIKVLPLTLEELGISPVALELVENEGRGMEESLDEQTKRGTVSSAVQQLIETVESDKQFVVVKVNTPAVDLNKDFNNEQLNFIKNDIFNSIQSQLGGEITEDLQEQWGTAFNTMMDIVDAEKKRH